MDNLCDLALEALACTAWQFEANRITFRRQPSADEWHILLAYVRTTGNLWWQGDALAQLSTEFEADVRANYKPNARHLDEEAVIARRVHERCSTVAKDAFPDDWQKAIESMRVCQILGEARLALSWQHHRDAIAECGRDREQAIEWLQEAEANKWTVSEMRAAIRLSNATSKTRPHSEQKTVTITSVLRKTCVATDQITQSRPVDIWSLQEIQNVIDAAQPLIKMLGAIEQRYSLFYPGYRILGK